MFDSQESLLYAVLAILILMAIVVPTVVMPMINGEADTASAATKHAKKKPTVKDRKFDWEEVRHLIYKHILRYH